MLCITVYLLLGMKYGGKIDSNSFVLTTSNEQLMEKPDVVHTSGFRIVVCEATESITTFRDCNALDKYCRPHSCTF